MHINPAIDKIEKRISCITSRKKKGINIDVEIPDNINLSSSLSPSALEFEKGIPLKRIRKTC